MWCIGTGNMTRKCDPLVSFCLDEGLTQAAESNELVPTEEIPRNLQDLSSNFLDLCRICHLYTGYSRRDATVRHQPGEGRDNARRHSDCEHLLTSLLPDHPWIDIVCRWVRSWPIDLGAYVRDPAGWPEPSIHRDAGCVCGASASCHICEKLRYAASLPIHHGLVFPERLIPGAGR